MIVEEEINAQWAKDERKKGSNVADETGIDFESEQEPDKENTGEVGGVSHATQEAGSAVFLPDREKRSANIFGDVELWVEVVPADEVSAWLVV